MTIARKNCLPLGLPTLPTRPLLSVPWAACDGTQARGFFDGTISLTVDGHLTGGGTIRNDLSEQNPYNYIVDYVFSGESRLSQQYKYARQCLSLPSSDLSSLLVIYNDVETIATSMTEVRSTLTAPPNPAIVEVRTVNAVSSLGISQFAFAKKDGVPCMAFLATAIMSNATFPEISSPYGFRYLYAPVGQDFADSSAFYGFATMPNNQALQFFDRVYTEFPDASAGITLCGVELRTWGFVGGAKANPQAETASGEVKFDLSVGITVGQA